MAGTTPVTPFKGYIGADGEFHLPISTDEFTLHQLWLSTKNKKKTKKNKKKTKKNKKKKQKTKKETTTTITIHALSAPTAFN